MHNGIDYLGRPPTLHGAPDLCRLGDIRGTGDGSALEPWLIS
jgi:hypothetical protein